MLLSKGEGGGINRNRLGINMPFEIEWGKAWALCPKYICRRVCLPSGESEVIVRRFESIGDFDDNGPQINLLWEICKEEGAKLPAVVSETEMGKKSNRF
jgi:hypothetical protein